MVIAHPASRCAALSGWCLVAHQRPASLRQMVHWGNSRAISARCRSKDIAVHLPGPQARFHLSKKMNDFSRDINDRDGQVNLSLDRSP
jgi:hypothetical protein